MPLLTNIKTLPLLLFLPCLYAFAGTDEATPTPAKPQNGVFFTYTGYMTTVLELKDGQFRYWFESDMKRPDEPAYPLTGKYSINGSTITLDNDKVSQKEWTFKTVNGLVTLWRPDATGVNLSPVAMMQLGNYGLGNVLISSQKPAEDLWKHRGPPVL